MPPAAGGRGAGICRNHETVSISGWAEHSGGVNPWARSGKPFPPGGAIPREIASRHTRPVSSRILAIDQGTTSSRALVVDGRGDILGSGQFAFGQHFPRPGWVEHDPEEIWSSTRDAIDVALRESVTEPRHLAAIGITNQRETVVIWDRESGAALAPAIVWQDRRTAARCAELKAGGHEATTQLRTGLTIDPYFSGTKIAWLIENVPAVREAVASGRALAGTVDSWLVWKLTGGQRHVTDLTNASRTLLFNIHRLAWDPNLCELLGVPVEILPEVQPSASQFGATDADVFGAEAPILAIAGDQQSALVGQACFAPGQAKNTYGTGCFLLANSGSEAKLSSHRLLTTLSASSRFHAPSYAQEGSVFVAGALVQWLRDGLGIIERSEEIEALAASVPDSGGVTIVPAFTGLGAPYWDPNARGAILGLTRGTGRGQIARAALEAIALSSAELVEAMAADLGAPIRELRVDGGASSDDLLMQMQADFSGIPVLRPKKTETTALGAAYLAGLGAGIWRSEEELTSLWALDRRFEPSIPAGERGARMAEWRRAVRRVLEGGGA